MYMHVFMLIWGLYNGFGGTGGLVLLSLIKPSDYQCLDSVCKMMWMKLQGSVIDALDRKIETLLRDWHQHPDMMFSIHPVDGSFLVW